MSNQIVITSGAKVRELEGVLTGTTGIVNALPINGSLGIPQLDVNGKILVSQLPNSVMEYLGTWNATTNTPYLVNGVGNAGDVYLVSVGGTHDFGAGPITFVVSDQVIYSGTIWQKASGTSGTVTSIGLSTNGNSLTIGNSPITTSGTITANFAGTSGQYINGAGNLTTFPTLITEAQTLITDVYNETGATLTKGTVVYINGGHGNLPTVTKALATSDATSAQTYGVVQTDITNMNNGHVVVIGSLGDLDTQAYANGTILYLSSTTAGAWTSTKQYAPAHLVYVGIVVRSHPTQGVVEIKIQNGYELDELHNVSAQSPLNNQGIFYNTSTSLWENKSIATALGYTPIGGSGSTGQVAFFNGGSTTLGGSSSLYWDNSTSRLGIGTNTPNASLGIVNSSSTGFQLRTSDTSNQYQANIYWDSSYGMVYGYNRIGAGTTANNITFYNSLGGFISVPESSTNNIGFNTINPQGLAGASVYDFTSLNTNVELRLHNSSTGYTSSDGSYIRVTSSALVIANAETSKSILINNGGNGVVTIDGTNKVAIGDIGVIPMTQQLTVVGSIEAYGGSIYQTVTSSMLKANASGQIIAAVGGTDYEYPLTFSSPLVRTTNTISMPAASTSVSGYLTSTDWNTFNNKGSGTVTSVSGTAPVVSSGGTTPTISMAAATTSVSGYLTSTDWNTFNGKFTLPSLTQGSVLFSNGSTIAQNNNRLYWDNTNMRLGVGSQSVSQYVMYVAANVGENANAWLGIDNKNATGSTALRLILNGSTTSGFQYVQSTNMTQVYANAGDIQLINGSSLGLTIANTTGAGTFSSSATATSFIKTGGTSSQFLKADGSVDSNSYYLASNPSGFTSNTGTVTSVATSAPLTGGTITTSGTIGITQATTSTNGYLSSTDWNTFNNKTTLPSLTSGSVLFSNGSTIAQDNANFYWDDTNNRLGIGTSAPASILHILGASATLIIDGNSAGTQTNAFLRLRTGGFNVGNFAYNLATDNIQISNVSGGSGGGVQIFGTGGSTTGLTIAAAGAATFSSSVSAEGDVNVRSASSLRIYRSDNTRYLTLYTDNNGCYVDANSATSEPLALQSNGASGRVVINTAGTERMRITSTGNVGIGTSSPNQSGVSLALSINSNNPIIELNRSDVRTGYLYTDGTEVRLSAVTAIPMTFYTTNTERMRITSGGDVLLKDASGNTAMTFTQIGSNIVQANSSNLILQSTGFNVYIRPNASYRTYIDSGTGLSITGSLSKGSGSFRIEHPLQSLSKTHELVHSFIEGPKADLIYRGKLTLANGKGQANIDEVSTMTEGTFEVLCREVQCFTTNESGWDLVKGKVIGNIIYIESQNANSTDEISWMVIGERKDKHMIDTEWTDKNGKVIVEPLKPIGIKP